MKIGNLSPLQSWLERIHGYLNQEEILKARFASLVLPVFEALELLNVLKKVCFKSSRSPSESLSHLIFKISILTYNIYFAGFEGFLNPKSTYLFHRNCHLVHLASYDKERSDITENLPPSSSPAIQEKQSPCDNFDENKNLNEQELSNHSNELKEDHQIEESNLENFFSPASQFSNPIPSHLPRECDENLSSHSFEERMQKLKTAPHIVEKRHSFQMIRNEIASRSQRISIGKSQSEPLVKNSLFSSLNLTSEDLAPSTTAENSNASILELQEEMPLSPPSFSHQKRTKIQSEEQIDVTDIQRENLKITLTPHQLKSIELFIQKPLAKTGSWKVKNHQIHVHPSVSFHVDPTIIDILDEARRLGLLSLLTFDQTFILHHNLKIIEQYQQTWKSHHLDQLLVLNQHIQSQLVAQWVQEDFQQGKFYHHCLKMISKMIALIRSSEGCAQDECARLFEEPSLASISDLFENWQYSNINHKLATQKLTVYDYYEILKVYFQALPQPIRQIWKPLKSASSQAEWNQALLELPIEDLTLIQRLLKMLNKSYEKIWSPHLEEMVTAAAPLFTYFCPVQEQEGNNEDQQLKLGFIKEALLSFKEK